MPKSADAFRTISEVADWLGVQTHVLRFWESKFTQIKPVKRAGGRRYYRPADMLLLGGIRKLLHEDGMTIKGVQKLLREEGMAHVADMSAPLDDETAAQIDDDIAPDADFVEAEFAHTATENTVTPFVPMAKAEPEETVIEPAEPAQAPELDPEPEPEPAVTHSAPEPDLAPAASPKPPERTPVTYATQEAEPQAASSPEAEPDADAPISEEPVLAASKPIEEAKPAPEPVFSRTPDPAPPVSSADLADQTDETDEPAELPAFLTGRRREPSPADGQQADATPPMTPPPAEPPKPKPRIVDVPDEPDPATISVTPSALGMAARITHLRPEQRGAIRPLLAQLTALRDQMASARQDAE